MKDTKTVPNKPKEETEIEVVKCRHCDNVVYDDNETYCSALCLGLAKYDMEN